METEIAPIEKAQRWSMRKWKKLSLKDLRFLSNLRAGLPLVEAWRQSSPARSESTEEYVLAESSKLIWRIRNLFPPTQIEDWFKDRAKIALMLNIDAQQRSQEALERERGDQKAIRVFGLEAPKQVEMVKNPDLDERAVRRIEGVVSECMRMAEEDEESGQHNAAGNVSGRREVASSELPDHHQEGDHRTPESEPRTETADCGVYPATETGETDPDCCSESETTGLYDVHPSPDARENVPA